MSRPLLAAALALALAVLPASSARADAPDLYHLGAQNQPLPTVTGPPEQVRAYRLAQRKQSLGIMVLAGGMILTVTGIAFVAATRNDGLTLEGCKSAPGINLGCDYTRSQRPIHHGVGIAGLSVGVAALAAGTSLLIVGGLRARRAKEAGVKVWVDLLPGRDHVVGGGQLTLA